jgi:hypothetical protein
MSEITAQRKVESWANSDKRFVKLVVVLLLQLLFVFNLAEDNNNEALIKTTMGHSTCPTDIAQHDYQ